MNGRPEIGRGLFYTRGSAGHSDIAPPQYVAWAQEQAKHRGVALEGTPATVTSMIEHGRSQRVDLYLDYGISGNHLSRPGLDALRHFRLAHLGRMPFAVK